MKTMKKIILILGLAVSLLLTGACTDDDSFSTSSSDILTFTTDTVKMDTVFSRVPTSTYSFWVHNNSGDGIRCTNIRLANGNQTGFRANVDGEYLSSTAGYQVSDVEIRKGDSIRVFVELTSPENGKQGPQLIEDDLVFQLGSGVEQRVNLRAYTWDAMLIRNLTVKNDTTIDGTEKPIVVYGNMKVDSNATLRLAAGTTLYFHSDAGLDVYGRLLAEGTAENNVTLRGDRLDNMFDYLPYDGVSGQWKGVHFNTSSYDNVMVYTDVHGTFDGIVCDSSDVSRSKLQLYNSTVHNCQGYGLKTVNSMVDVHNCQITNTLNNCVAILGGDVTLLHCTLAQFYPFDSNRGAALAYTNYDDNYALPLLRMDCINSIVTGYGDDQVMGGMLKDAEDVAFNYRFVNSILRTTPPSDDDTSVPEGSIVNVIWEDANSEDSEKEDSITGEKHFKLVDIDKQRYDFHLSMDSPAINRAAIEYSEPTDRDGITRDEQPDMGCYEYVKSDEEQQ